MQADTSVLSWSYPNLLTERPETQVVRVVTNEPGGTNRALKNKTDVPYTVRK